MSSRSLVLLITASVIATACTSPPPRRPGEEYLETIKFEGNKQIKSKDLLNGLGLHRTQKAGRAPDPYTVKSDAERLRGQYQREGYLEIDVQQLRRREQRRGLQRLARNGWCIVRSRRTRRSRSPCRCRASGF